MFQRSYHYKFKDVHDVEHTLEFWKDSGTIIYSEEITADANPFIVTYPATDTKLQPVRGSGCEINILSTNSMKFIDLYTTSMLEMQIELWRGEDVVWIGYLDSELYSEPFDQYDNYPVSLTGNDGLALLDRIDFLDVNGLKYTGFQSNWFIISEILKKLKITWNNIYVGSSTVSFEYPYNSGKTIFDNTYSLTDNFYDEDGKAMSCREVLENILLLFGCYIQQINGNIYITDVNAVCLDPVGTPTTTTTTTTPTTTTTTTMSPSCYQITDKLKFGFYTGQTTCSEPTTDTYYGNSSNFALTTTISASPYCSVTLGGYYSNGAIWKYTSDGINFTSSGTCIGTTTTTTTTMIESNNYVYFDRLSGNDGVMKSNITGGTVVITYDYYVSASCDNVGTDGQDPNSATSELLISEDSGATWTSISSAYASITGGNFPYSQADDDYVTGSTTITTTNVDSIVFGGTIQCDSGRNGQGGAMQVSLKSATVDSVAVRIGCSDTYLYECGGSYLSCTTIISTTTTTYNNPPIINTPPYIMYDSDFNYISNEVLTTNLGDVSTIGFATDVQVLNILSPINKQKVTWSPYINNKILDWEASADSFWSLYSSTYYGTYPNNWKENLYLSAGLTGSTDSNYYQTFMPHIWFSGYFGEAIGQNNNLGTYEKYLKIDHGFLDTIDSPKHVWVGELPSVIGTPDLYYLKVEVNAMARTKDSMSGPASATDVRRLALSTNLKIGDKYYGGSITGWTTTTTNYIWNFTDYTKNQTTQLYESTNIADKYVDLKADRIYNVEPPRVVYIPLWGFTGHDIHLTINSYEAFGSTGTDITSSVYDVRVKKVKITVVDKNKVDVPNLDIDYVSYVNKNVKDDGTEITLKIGTNIDTTNGDKSFVPTAKGSILKKVGTSYDFITNFNRKGKTDILENLLSRSIVSNYTNKTIEIGCTINKINSIFGYLTYNNYWPNIKFGIQGAILDYHEDTAELVLQEINVDNLDIKKNY